MTIIVIEGLSLTGKTTLCKRLNNYYSNQGIRCRYCPHGHLTDSQVADVFYQNALQAWNSWDVNAAINWSMKSIRQDYETFCQEKSSFEDELIFLDRHFTSQFVMAEYFMIDFSAMFNKVENYYEFLLTCDFKELHRRSIIRGDNHSKLTDYTLSTPDIHQDMERLYRKYVLQHGTPKNHIIDNTIFQSFDRILPIIDNLI